uniref:TonB family protein n=1 Tax=uncultured Altererythrobacter sp. TaxID=500840 RepID=UPI002625162F|nr:TonB family protein [uncultured Altererythrobacter sp.]
MKALLASGAIGALALSAQPGIAQENADDDTLILQPSSDWQLREMDDRCRLSRRFGSGEDRTTLWIDKAGFGPTVNVTFIGRPMRHPHGTNIDVAFSPQASLSRNYITSKSSKGRPAIALFGVRVIADPRADSSGTDSSEVSARDEEDVDIASGEVSSPYLIEDGRQTLESITSIDLSRAVIQPVSLILREFPEAIQSLSECSDTLVKRLQDNSDLEARAGTPPAPQGQQVWARELQQAYPRHLLARGEEASIAVRMTVNTKGRASFCEVLNFSGSASFNDTACLLLLRHARFSPATNSDGDPVPSFYRTQITYRIN